MIRSIPTSKAVHEFGRLLLTIHSFSTACGKAYASKYVVASSIVSIQSISFPQKICPRIDTVTFREVIEAFVEAVVECDNEVGKDVV